MAITPKTYAGILKYGTQANYDALATKDASVLYFCTDTKKIYKGTVDFTDSVVYSTKNADVTAPIVGKLYIFSATGTTEVYNGTSWTVVSYPMATAISATSDDVHTASAKAIYDFVEAEIESAITGTDVVKSIAATTGTEGSITYTTGDGTTHDVALSGVVTTPTYDATSRKFTFPVVSGDDVVVELGTDIFIDPNANNRYENGNIYLYLNDAKGEKAATELVIPVTSLVTDYFGDDTDSIKVDIDSSTHKVTASAILRPDVTGETPFTNALKLSTAEGAKGLYVDLSAVEADIDALEGRMDTAEGTLEKLDGADTVEGSVKKQIKDAVEALDATVSQAAGTDGLALSVTEVDGKLTAVTGSIAANTYDAYGAASAVQGETTKTVKDIEDAAATAQAKADQNEADIAALYTALTTWGTF